MLSAKAVTINLFFDFLRIPPIGHHHCPETKYRSLSFFHFSANSRESNYHFSSAITLLNDIIKNQRSRWQKQRGAVVDLEEQKSQEPVAPIDWLVHGPAKKIYFCRKEDFEETNVRRNDIAPIEKQSRNKHYKPRDGIGARSMRKSNAQSFFSPFVYIMKSRCWLRKTLYNNEAIYFRQNVTLFIIRLRRRVLDFSGKSCRSCNNSLHTSNR